MRDWQSVLLLIGFPLIIIGLIFVSFEPSSLQVPVGSVNNAEDFEYQDFRETAEQFADLKKYDSREKCISDVEKYRIYACAVVEETGNPGGNGSKGYRMKLHYDNTREIVDQKLLDGIKTAARDVEKKYSEDKASRVLNEAENLTASMNRLQRTIRETDRDLEGEIDLLDLKIGELNRTKSRIEQDQKKRNRVLNDQISQMDAKINDLRRTREDLRTDLEQMDADVNDFEKDLEDINRTRRKFYRSSKERLSRIRTNLNELDNLSRSNSRSVDEAKQTVNEADSDLEEYNDNLSREIEEADRLIDNYRDFRKKSNGYLGEINRTIEDLNSSKQQIEQFKEDSNTNQYLSQVSTTINDLKSMKKDLGEYRGNLGNLYREIESTETRYSTLTGYDPSEVASSLSVAEDPTYSPGSGSPAEPSELGSNILVLQTIYSTLLLLVSIFVSVLVSMFVTLKQINSASKKRLRVTSGVFAAEYIAVYCSSMIIISVPVMVVLALGRYFFKLSVFSNMPSVFLILFLLCSSIVNLSITVAYIVEEKSMTMLVGSFLLVFFIFFSGFVLPIEMMAPIPGAISRVLPGNLALKAFDLKVLYGQSLFTAYSKIVLLAFWSVVFSATALAFKKRKGI